MLKKLLILLYPFILLSLLSCANELPLTGGEKDTTPPKVLKCEPANESVKFSTNKITITFDEYIKLKDANKQILISPPGTEYQVADKGKFLELTILNPLKPNSTYVINFGSCVIDNNEGNVLNELIYSFSTGDVLDSLKTPFRILDAFTLKGVADVKLMLYDQDIDSLPLTSLPYYAGNSNADGKVIIGNMKPGAFKAFVLKEENKNYLFDKPNEGIGFLNNLIVSGDSNVTNLLLFYETAANPKVSIAKMPYAGLVCFKFNGKVWRDQLRLISRNYELDTNKFEFINGRKDTANFWFKPKLNDDTLKFMFERTGGEKDTIKLFPKIINTYKNNLVTGAVPIKQIATIPADFDYYKKPEIEFNMVPDSINHDTITLLEEGKPVKFNLAPVPQKPRHYTIQYDFKQTKNYVFYLPRKSVKGLLGSYIDSTLIQFKTSNEKAYKTCTIHIKNPEFTGKGILQLLDAKDQIIQTNIIQWDNNGPVIFNYLRQGSYRLRLIYDVNMNGEWDTGHYSKKILPEKVVYFPQNIDIKPNFDYEMEWDIMK